MLQKYEEKIQTINSGLFFGIDLGTTYTVIAVVDMSEAKETTGHIPVRRIAVEQFSPMDMAGSERSDMIASVLGVRKDGQMFVGNRLYQLKGHPDYQKDVNLFYHWKLDLGISTKPLYKKAFTSDVDDATKVAGKILNYCRIQVVGKEENWENVVVTVPASFQTNQRNDVIKAVEYARIKNQNGMLFDEPNAAFIGYLNQLNSEERYAMFEKTRTRILVVDFGGGTCDLSVVELQKPEYLELKMSNLAISRYNDLGGQDLDMIIAEEYLLPAFHREFEEDDFSAEDIEQIILPQLAVLAERLKIELSRIISARFMNYADIPETAGLVSRLNNQIINIKGEVFKIEELVLNFNQFRRVTEYFFTKSEYRLQVVDKIIRSVPCVVDDILEKANLSFTDIHHVLFVGGSVQNLIFVQECMRFFTNSTVLLPQRPDTLVAEGAAVYSFYKNALGIELLHPICSDTFGVTIHNNSFFTLIPAGTQLPFSVKLPSFGIQSERQKKLTIPFCIGDGSKVVANLNLDIPQRITIQDVITIHATLTENKLLKVDVEFDGKSLGKVELMNPFQLANLSEEQRELFETIQQLENARSRMDRNQEKKLMRDLISEYYELGNYTRVTALGADWLEKFDPTDVYMNNMLFCAYDNLGNRRHAEQHLDTGLKYSPENHTLIYNKSLLIEKSKGSEEAVRYLRKQPERVLLNNSIRFRLALLEYHSGNRKPAGEIAEEYNKGGFEFVENRSEKRQLNKIAGLFGFPIRVENENSGSNANVKSNKKQFNEDDLLKINTSLNE
jgi:molecular chaperone DnaK (HSP70)